MRPGVRHVVLDTARLVVAAAEVGVGVEMAKLVVSVVVGSRQPPNQPRLVHVDVVVVVVTLEVLVAAVVVVSSRQPHQPGVLHVSVLVGELVDETVELVVVTSEWLLL